jgi:hypothetical protein
MQEDMRTQPRKGCHADGKAESRTNPAYLQNNSSVVSMTRVSPYSDRPQRSISETGSAVSTGQRF